MDDAPFEPDSLAALDEPVRRYLAHALDPGAPTGGGMRLRMRGRIDVGRWLDFDAEQEVHGHAFRWRARAGWGRFRPLGVTDSYREGSGSTEGRLFGRLRFLHAEDTDTARSAAGRAAAESIWVPSLLLPEAGVVWRAERDDVIVALVSVPPERPEVKLRIGADGSLRSVGLLRWGNTGQKHFGYIPFGGDAGAERRFGDVVIPSRVTVGWWYGTPRYKPFFKAEVVAAERIA